MQATWVKPKSKKQLKKMFDKNFRVLSHRWPHIAKMMKSLKGGLKCEPVFDSLLGRPNLIVHTPDGKKVYLHSPDPIAEAQTKVNSPKNRYPQFLVFLGLGLGFYPLFFLKEKGKYIKHMLVIERYPDILYWAMHLVDLTPLFTSPKFELAVGLPKENVFPFLRKYMEASTRKYFSKVVKIITHEPSLYLAGTYYKHTVTALRDAIRETLLFFGNDPEDSLIGLDHIIENLDIIALNPGIKELFGAFKGKPAICVASGPSLKKNAHLLKEIQDKAIIICCDATLKPLLYKFGIKPHFVTSLERVEATAKFFENLPYEDVKDTWLAACPVVVRKVYENYPGPNVIVYRDFAHFKWIGIDKGILRIGPSCANMSFKIAEALGCDPIILVGQDLAFAETGESHVEGHEFGTQNVKPDPNCFYVRGNYSEKVLTTRTWYMFLKHFELDIAGYKGTCINATEGGAYIAGTKVMKLSEALEEYANEKIYALDTIRDKLKKPSPEQVMQDLEGFKGRVEETRAFMNETIERYKKELEKVENFNKNILSKILSRNEDKLLPEEIDEAKRLYEDFTKTKVDTMGHTLFYLYPMHIVQAYVIKSEVELTETFEKYNDINFSYIEWVAKHEEWFKVMIKLLETCNSRLDLVIQKVKEIEEKLYPFVKQ